MHLKFLRLYSTLATLFRFPQMLEEDYSLHDYCLGGCKLLGREDFKQGHDRRDEILQNQWGKCTSFM